LTGKRGRGRSFKHLGIVGKGLPSRGRGRYLLLVCPTHRVKNKRERKEYSSAVRKKEGPLLPLGRITAAISSDRKERKSRKGKKRGGGKCSIRIQFGEEKESSQKEGGQRICIAARRGKKKGGCRLSGHRSRKKKFCCSTCSGKGDGSKRAGSLGHRRPGEGKDVQSRPQGGRENTRSVKGKPERGQGNSFPFGPIKRKEEGSLSMGWGERRKPSCWAGKSW